jgi:hypothetical protein
VSIAIEDEWLGCTLAFEVDGAEALAASHQPYAAWTGTPSCVNEHCAARQLAASAVDEARGGPVNDSHV